MRPHRIRPRRSPPRSAVRPGDWRSADGVVLPWRMSRLSTRGRVPGLSRNRWARVRAWAVLPSWPPGARTPPDRWASAPRSSSVNVLKSGGPGRACRRVGPSCRRRRVLRAAPARLIPRKRGCYQDQTMRIFRRAARPGPTLRESERSCLIRSRSRGNSGVVLFLRLCLKHRCTCCN